MKTIFMVHDQEEDPAARQNFLEMAGYHVVLMQSGHELSMALREDAPDLVLLDVLVDGRNGFEICHELTARFGKRLRIILSSRVYQASVFQEEARRAGAADYITLPMNLDDYVGRINAVMSDSDA